VISVSYGLCEVDNGAAENAAFDKMYQMAASMGISVFVATGDGTRQRLEDGDDAVVVVDRQRVEFVVVTAGARQRQSEERLRQQ